MHNADLSLDAPKINGRVPTLHKTNTLYVLCSLYNDCVLGRSAPGRGTQITSACTVVFLRATGRFPGWSLLPCRSIIGPFVSLRSAFLQHHLGATPAMYRYSTRVLTQWRPAQSALVHTWLAFPGPPPKRSQGLHNSERYSRNSKEALAGFFKVRRCTNPRKTKTPWVKQLQHRETLTRAETSARKRSRW